MSKLTFPQKNNFIVKHSDAKFFDKDLELFKKECPGHKLNNQLTRVSDYNKSKLVGQMLSILLDKVTPEEILANREKEIIVQPERKTIEETKDFLLNTIGVDEDDLEAMGDAYIEFLSFKSDDELIYLFANILSSRITEKQDPVVVEGATKAEQTNQEKAQDTVIVEGTAKAEQTNQEKAQDPVVVEETAKAEQTNQEKVQDPVIVEETAKAEQTNQEKAQDPVVVEETDKKKEAKAKNSPK